VKTKGLVMGIFLLMAVALVISLAGPEKVYAQAWKAEWEKTLAAAKKEGKVVVAGPPGQTYRNGLVQFSKAYPEIQLDYVGLQGRDFAPRIVQERRAGQFLWDVHVGGASSVLSIMVPQGAVDPLTPALILPEVQEESKWLGGFKDGWMDHKNQLIYGFIASLSFAVHVNRDLVPETEFGKVEDLWNPKWKGKMIWHDPRAGGSGATQAYVIHQNLGEEALRRLLRDQEAAVTEDYRQQAEWLVQGRYPIGIGLIDPVLRGFQKEGVGKNVKPLKEPKLSSIISGFGNLAIINRAPNPNAAKVYINWLLSREGQAAWAKATGDNSRRSDVAPGDPEFLPKPGVKYINAQKEEAQALRKKIYEIAKESLK